MPANRRSRPPAARPEDVPFLAEALSALAAMPAPMRNARLTLFDAIHNLPNERLAVIAKAVQPHLTDREVAALVGVTLRSVQRWERFQGFKTTLDDYLESKRREYHLPDETAA